MDLCQDLLNSVKPAKKLLDNETHLEFRVPTLLERIAKMFQTMLYEKT